MGSIFLKYYNKFFAKRWTIGLGECNVKEMLRAKAFDPDIYWFPENDLSIFEADPFILMSENGRLEIFYEEFSVKDGYGKIMIADLDKNFLPSGKKALLDTGSHLSYPFLLNEGGIIYVIPESSQAGMLSCYRYDRGERSVTFVRDLISLPLLDSTILKHDGKYWIFGIVKVDETDYNLMIFYSNDLLGPYTGHPGNPVKKGLNGTRPAGNFIMIGDSIFRPVQNCEKIYGESITIFRISLLNRLEFKEERYMDININRSNLKNKGIHSIHTLNFLNGNIVIDGERWIFAPVYRLKSYIKKIISTH